MPHRQPAASKSKRPLLLQAAAFASTLLLLLALPGSKEEHIKGECHV
ncbi:MAG: hypothetical protein ACTFAL_00150 [Candidatus Electronema sp. V4]